ncbi:hypothetical protein ABC977_04660 [Thioalkalicoccus limnaeus]|uniref:J domain-containing protein n=1 Tax=Thioalkalicoccus limnaeus TaxID=120681 RepID=A0ABV4BEA5_9GAMM
MKYWKSAIPTPEEQAARLEGIRQAYRAIGKARNTQGAPDRRDR